MGDPVGAAAHILQGILGFFDHLAPGGLGLVLIPLIALAIVTILATFRR